MSLSSPLRVWTSVERTQVLDMLDQGKHFSDIAAAFCLSRSAVAGRVNRDTELHDHVCFAPKKPPKPKILKAKRETGPKRPEAKQEAEPFHVKPQRLSPMRNVPLMELGANQCRWPVAAVPGVIGGHLFCGRPTAFGEAYCEPHKRMARPKGSWGG